MHVHVAENARAHSTKWVCCRQSVMLNAKCRSVLRSHFVVDLRYTSPGVGRYT